MTTIVNLDLSNVQPWGASAPILPVGDKQKVVIVSGELKGSRTDAENGQLQLLLNVIEGPNAGKSGGLTLGIFHKDEKPRGIARQKASALCLVTTGRAQLGDLRELYNIPFYVDVVPQEGSKYTEIARYYNAQGVEPQQITPQGHAPQAAAPSFAPAPQTAAPAQAAFAPPAVAYDPNAAAPVAGFSAPAAAPGFNPGFNPGGAFPGAVPAPAYSAPAAAPAAPGFGGGFPTPPQAPGAAPAATPSWNR